MTQAVNDYIENIKQPWQIEIAKRLRETIVQAMPDVEEKIQYGKPHFKRNGQYAAVLGTAKGWVTLTIFNATALEAEEGFFEDGPPERKTVKILEGQSVDYDRIGKLLQQAAATLKASLRPGGENMAITFSTILIKDGEKNATGISIPPQIIDALGSGKKPKVKVSVNGYSYRTTVAAYGDVFMLPVSQEHRAAAGVQAGDAIEVTLELDTKPRLVTVPDDLAAALAAKPDALAAFDTLAYSARKEYVRNVESAKAQETRERRIASIVAKMGAGDKL